MELVECPECGKEISATAAACPYCGASISDRREVKTNVKQGALIGAVVCFLVGIILMFVTLWSFIAYVPLFFAAFVLSIVAIAQKRIAGGIIMLLVVVIVPFILFFVLLDKRLDSSLDETRGPISISEKTLVKEDDTSVQEDDTSMQVITPSDTTLPYSWTEGDIGITIYEVFLAGLGTKGGWVSDEHNQYKVRISYKNLTHRTTKSGASVGYLRLMTDRGNLYDPKYVGGSSCSILDPEDTYDTEDYTFNMRKEERPTELWRYKNSRAEEPDMIFKGLY